MSLQKLFYVLKRALDGVRRRPWLHLLSLCTLFATFLCFSLTLSLAQNLDRLLARWVGGAELTVYIKDGVPESDMERLATALSQTPEVARIDQISSTQAKEIFAREMGEFSDMVRSLPASSFPASVEIHINPAFLNTVDARKQLAERLGALSMVERVDCYDDWFSKLSAVSTIGRITALGLGLSALIVAILVISAVVRTGVSARAREIEVLGLVGATERYIRFPFLLEGALEASIAMSLAVICLQGLLSRAESALNDVMPLIGINALSGFSAQVIVMLVLGSALAGLLGSRLSMKGALQQG